MMKNQKALDYKIAFISASWHEDLVGIAVDSCRSELSKLGVDQNNIKHVKVPGSLEIPLVSKLLVNSGEYDAVIAFGLVVDGGIYRHEFVAQTVLDGMMKVALDSEVPVLSVVLTPQRFNENNPVHTEFFQKHLVTKGIEAAHSAVKTIQVVKQVAKK